MGNPEEEIKKIQSIKCWRIEVSHYWSLVISITGDLLWLNRVCYQNNERNHKCKRCYNKLLSVLIQFLSMVKGLFFFSHSSLHHTICTYDPACQSELSVISSRCDTFALHSATIIAILYSNTILKLFYYD